jgi:hypothetical protein
MSVEVVLEVEVAVAGGVAMKSEVVMRSEVTVIVNEEPANDEGARSDRYSL